MSHPSRAYPPHSKVDPRIELRQSPIAGKGLFAREFIAEGEIVIRWGGEFFSLAQVRAGVARERSLGVIGEDLYIGTAVGGPENSDEFLNHSCDPTLWMVDEATLSARRDILPGQEVTTDYGLWETDLQWRMPCNCASPLCRGIISGDAWLREDLRIRYGEHFSPYILARIRREPQQ